jgi:hypothetical protein
VISKPSSLFSLFFPKFTASDIGFAAEILACGQSGRAKNSEARRCSSQFLITIEIARNFTIFRTAAGYGHATLLFLQRIYRH